MLTHTRLREGERLCVVVRDVKSLPSAAIETKNEAIELTYQLAVKHTS